MSKVYLRFFVIFLMLPKLVLAQSICTSEIPCPPEKTKKVEKKKENKCIDFSGYLDGSYNYLLRSNRFISGIQDRVLDLEPNGFTLQQLAFTLAKQPEEGFGGLLNVFVGRDAFTLAPYGFNPNFGLNNIGYDINQAYLQYKTGPLVLMGGNFVALSGSEAIDLTKNTNFSRSIIFGYAQPFTLLGFRFTYTVNDALKLMGGINNGWDNIRDGSRGKTIELATSYTLNSLFSFAIAGYSGEERATSQVNTGPVGRRNLVDVVATLNATKQLSFVMNYDYAAQSNAALANGEIGKATWQGIAGYINYKFNDHWRSSFRGEIFNDQDGFRTGVAQVWKELTLTIGYSPVKNLEFRAEARRDFSNVDSFSNANGITASNNQQSYALEAIYKF